MENTCTIFFVSNKIENYILKKLFEQIKEEDLLLECFERMNETLCKHKQIINKNKCKCIRKPNSKMNHEHIQAKSIKE
jgi:hypothetical protein